MNLRNLLRSQEKGSALISTLVAAGIIGILLLGVVDMTKLTTKMQSNMNTTLDQGLLIDDIRNSLKNPTLCMQRFGSVNPILDLNTTRLKFQAATGELIDQDTTLVQYSLNKVSLVAVSADKVQEDLAAGKRTLVFGIALKSSKKTGELNRDRILGSLFVITDLKGKTENCSFENVSDLVVCPSGQIQVSQGAGSVPRCETINNLIGKMCGPNEVLITNNGQSQPYCANLSTLLGKICPAGEVLVSGGSSGTATCQKYVAASAVTAPAAVVPSKTPVTTSSSSTLTPSVCAAGEQSTMAVDGSGVCKYSWSQANVGEAGRILSSSGPIQDLSGTCVSANGAPVWDWRIKCASAAGTTCQGGRYTKASLSGNTVCSFDFKMAKVGETQGPLFYSDGRGGKGEITGSCMDGGRWQYYVTCNDGGSVSCSAGEQQNGKCWFRWNAARAGETASSYDSNGTGSVIRATCGSSGTWTNVSISPNQCN